MTYPPFEKFDRYENSNSVTTTDTTPHLHYQRTDNGVPEIFEESFLDAIERTARIVIALAVVALFTGMALLYYYFK